MARLCERPGCSEPGAAAYGMRPEDLVFWLAPLDRWNQHGGGVLCRRHADAMVVPRGWTLDDLREPVPRLFRPPDPSGARAAPRRRAARPRRARDPVRDPAVEQLELAPADPPAESPVPSDAGADEDPSASAWSPAFDVDDDLDGLLDVRSPLLARAFRGGDRTRRSSG